MSFRLRVILLVMFIAVTATAATAWLTLRQASRQLDESRNASQQEISLITKELEDYARTRGGWDGVAAKIADLSQRTNQRIRVTTTAGTVVADSDTLAGKPAHDVVASPLVVDPRPTWQPTSEISPNTAKIIWFAREAYRFNLHNTACLTKAGVPVQLVPGKLVGIPQYKATDGDDATIDRCDAEAQVLASPIDYSPSPEFAAAIDHCMQLQDAQTIPCLQTEFTNAIDGFAPAPLRVYIGAAEDPQPRLAEGSIAATAGIVAVIAVGVSLLLSRRVLRPIGALTAASRRVGDGDLAERVPVTGHDELAQLGRSFNRMADSLQRSEERQHRMITDVAHELRTPLANLRGYLEALKDGVLPPSPELFASLHEEALLQQRIVDDLQDLALAEAGALTYYKIRLDLTELMATCRTAHAATAAATRVNLVAVGDQPTWACGDPDRLRQVIANLIRNALAATTSGGTITLTVTARDGQAIINVTDTGTGIAETDLPHLFDRFWRADPARGRIPESTAGSGLGLAIARQIITDHNGTITVASRIGLGTTFTIYLPAA